jgi:hypothetical protein
MDAQYLRDLIRNSPTLAKIIINSNECTKELLESVDSNNWNCLMYACYHHPSVTQCILESKFCSKELLLQVNKQNNNCLMIACKYQSDATKYILESTFCCKELFEQRGVDQYNCLMMACRYQGNSIKHILESTFCCKELLEQRSVNQYNCLMIACHYNVEYIDLISESEFFKNEMIFESTITGWNSLSILCQHNPDHIETILKFNVPFLLRHIVTKFALSRLPDRLLNYNIGNGGQTFLHILAIFHPEYIKNVIIYVDEDLKNVEDNGGNKFYTYLLPNYKHVLELFYNADSEEYNKYIKQSKVHGITDTVCAMCLENEYSHIFNCGHCSCQTCMKHIERCHICKKNITHRIKIYL